VNGSVGTVIAFKSKDEALREMTEIGLYEPKEEERWQPKDNPTIQRLPANRKYPLVKFTNGKILLVIPLEFEVNNSEGHMEARRDQVCNSRTTP
jgi:hypothetical protein